MVRHESLQLSIAAWASQLLWCSQICRAEGLIGNHMSVCQNYGPFLGTLNFRCHIIIGTRKGTIILTTTHMEHQMENELENMES